MTRNILVAGTAVGVVAFAAAHHVRDARAVEANVAQGVANIEVLKSPAGSGAAESNLTVGPDGKVYLSWIEPAPDSASALRFATFDGSAWSAPQTIYSGRNTMVNWADFPSLAVGPNGRMAAHWLQRFGRSSYQYDIRIAQSSNGGRTWTTGDAPHVDRSDTEKGFVTFWREGDGFGVAWLDGRKADKARPDAKQEMMVFATTVGAPGAPARETELDGRACDCCQTTAAMTANGPIVAYRDRTPNEIRDISVTRRVNGKWTTPVPVYNDNWEINACPVNGPFVDAKDRRVVLAWFTAAKDTPRVKVAFSSDAGATFSAPITVDEGAPAGRVAAQLLDDGSAVVSWIERTRGDTASVRARRVREKEGAGPAMTIAASSAARAAGFPRMARSANTLYFAWTVPTRPSSVQFARVGVSAFK
ncbi:MAG: exo-alpha-sialidase [Gemmatimonadetes bacterium]|nr:exo-alpha-sialidase [Gemmatimonadota bacterium]